MSHIFVNIFLIFYYFNFSYSNQLLFVQSVWRNGNRNPLKVCKNDENQLETWKQGWGWLTWIGMGEQFQLGSTIYNEYAVKEKFLKENYDPREIYVRSSDTNRTLISANSNMMGMYYNRTSNIENFDFPNDIAWPKGYVPVAVHTDLSYRDYVFGLANCNRREYLLEQLKLKKEFTDYHETFKEQLSKASQKCGNTISEFNTNLITDSWDIEMDQYREILFDENEINELKQIGLATERFIVGKEYDEVTNTELVKTYVGSLIQDIIQNIELKIFCLDAENAKTSSCDAMKNLKYYAYSGDASLLTYLLWSLSLKEKLLKDSFVKFSSAIMFELWNDSVGQYGLKIKYYSPNEGLKDVTTLFNGSCSLTSEGFCLIEHFKLYLQKYISDDVVKFCENVPDSAQLQQPKVRKSRVINVHEAITDASSTDELIFVQALWRHGDRTPTGRCPNDKNDENSWHFGFGQLTSIGMAQQRLLGSLIYERYVEQLKFLKPYFDSNEIYVRSTDFHRTIASAMSNMVGMYYNRTNLTAGLDYPDIDGWPKGFVPVPVHVINVTLDHMGDPNTFCPRQLKFMSVAANSSEIKLFEMESEEFLKNISTICGRTVNLFGLTKPTDTNFIEGLYNKSQLFSNSDFIKMKEMNKIQENVNHGLLAYNYVQYGYNLKIEIAKLRGGSYLWDIIDHFDHKIYCMNVANENSEECKWIKPLKYFILSAHDSTILALLTTLGIKDCIVTGAIPEYTAAVLLELYKTPDGFKVQARFHKNYESTGFEDITNYITGCPSEGKCPFETFKERSWPYFPHDINEMCLNIPNITDAPVKSAFHPFENNGITVSLAMVILNWLIIWAITIRK